LGRNFPGVAIHAQVLEQILSNTFLNRADWVSGLELVGFAGLGLLLLLAVILAGPFWSLVVALGFGGLVAGGAWAMYLHQRLLLDPSFPLLGLFTLYSAMLFARYLTADRDRRKIRAAFSHYVAPALLAEIERNRASLKLGGEIRELTVMFADVRGFTSLSENTTPRELVGTLNILFSALGEEITRRSGTIDKFIGDAIMAFWNAPLDVEDHPRMACLAALGMRESLARLNESNGFGLGPGRTVTIGIGISTGEALVGNMGLETRFDYSCVGDTVNVASRVEGACKVVGYDVVVVDSTRSAAPELAFLDAGSIALKGKAARALIHILVGDAALARSPTFKALESAHRTAIASLGQGRIADDAMAQCLALSRSVDPRLQEFYRLLPERQEDFAREALSDDFEAKAARLLGT
jgi:adenylate cyclase